MHAVELIYHTLTLERDVVLSVWTVKDFGETVEISQGFVMYLHVRALCGFLVLQLPGSGRCWTVTVCHHSSHLSSQLFQHISTVRVSRNSDRVKASLFLNGRDQISGRYSHNYHSPFNYTSFSSLYGFGLLILPWLDCVVSILKLTLSQMQCSI